MTHILMRAMRKRPIAGADTAALQTADFTPVLEMKRLCRGKEDRVSKYLC